MQIVGRRRVGINELRFDFALLREAKERVVDHVAVVTRHERGRPHRIEYLQVGVRHNLQNRFCPGRGSEHQRGSESRERFLAAKRHFFLPSEIERFE